MRKVLGVLALAALLAGCGSDNKTGGPAPTATAAAEQEAGGHDLAGYTEGVKRHYGAPHTHAGANGDVEAEYHQPPKPPGTMVGGEIELTGTEIGVRMVTTVTKVEPEGEFLAVHLDAVSTGIAMFPGPFQGELTFPGGKVVPNDPAAEAECTEPLQSLWVGEGEHAKGCLLFPREGDEQPEQVQVSLQAVPVEAGGIWKLPR
jgi:hypothetical protein